MPYILSPEQKVVVDAILSKETSSTKYFDVVTALQSICKACTSILGQGKKILIQIPEGDAKTLLLNMFEENGLNDLTIDLSNKNSIPELDVIKLRTTLKKQKDTDAIINYTLSTKKENTIKSQIASFYDAFDQKVLADTPFRDFVINSIYKKKSASRIQSNHAISMCPLQYSASEYYAVKKEIATAAQIYHRQYDLYDHLSLFKEDLWVDISETSIIKIKNQLDEFKQESSLLVHDFNKASTSLLEDSTKELASTFINLEHKFSSHEESCIAFHIKSTTPATTKEGMFSLFKKKKSQSSNKIYVDSFDELSGMIQSISQEWYEELDAPTTEMISYDYIMNFINSNREKADGFKTKITKNIQESVQRINKINTSSAEVKSLDQRLEALIEKMNTSSLFNLSLEHNILSFVKQLELCNNIANYIEKCHILVHSSSSYLEWKSFFNGSGELFQFIFNDLKNQSKNVWNEIFENWYEYQVHNHVLGQKSISPEVLSKYHVQTKSSNQVEVASVIANLQTGRITGAELLKETTKELHNTLFKKKQLPGVSWNNTALMNRPFMQTFFPIHISENISYSAEYDIVISFSNNKTNENTSIHSFTPIQSEDIENISKKRDNFLYLNDYNYKGLLAQLSSTDKLKASKKLAKYILSLNQNIKIYQLKNANIISLLPTQDDSHLENELDKINVKVIDTSGVLYDRLTESILLTERKPYLILKDELINPELHEHALWQLKIIHLFKQVGYEIVSLNTTDQLVDNDAQFIKIIQKIGGSITNSTETVSQLSDKKAPISEEA